VASRVKVRSVALACVPAVVAAAAGLRQWLSVREGPLTGDAVGYMDIATAWTPLDLVGGRREPVWPTLVALPVRLLGPEPDIIRLLGVAGFVLLVMSFQLVARKLYGSLWAAAGALALAMSPWLIHQSARGYREETTAALVLLFALGVMSARSNPKRLPALAAGAALVGLLRFDTLLLTLPTLLVAFTLHRPPVRVWLASAVVFAALVSPILFGNWIRFGDPMYHVNFHARRFTNKEFRDQPGFPTSAELKNLSDGPPTTWGAYLFELHTPTELATRTLSGVQHIGLRQARVLMFYPNLPEARSPVSIVSALMALTGVLGGALLLRGAAWSFGLLMFLSLVEFAPIARLTDDRLALTFIPLLVLGYLQALVVLTRHARLRLLGLALERSVKSLPHAVGLGRPD
jgi:hypothetical protein